MDYTKDFEDGYEYTSLGAIHYMHHPGTKEKIIFLHGVGSNTKAFSKLMQFLPDELDIFLIDLLGHGQSDAPDIDYTISNQFQALREFIAMQNNGDSYMFGHSYGGWVAAYYATQPCSTKGIILEDSAGLKEMFDEIIQSGKKDEYIKNLLNTILKVAGNKEKVFKSILESDFGEDQLTSEVLSKISANTKIIWGSDDKIVDVKFAQVFNNYIKGSSLNIVKGAGHEPHYTNAEEVAKLILGFMRPA
jgi:pimeloyl-ACP methyl ester carboxylesterase